MIKKFKNLTVVFSIFLLTVLTISTPLSNNNLILPMCDLLPEKVHQ